MQLKSGINKHIQQLKMSENLAVFINDLKSETIGFYKNAFARSG
jgi:hypothetical protein